MLFVGAVGVHTNNFCLFVCLFVVVAVVVVVVFCVFVSVCLSPIYIYICAIYCGRIYMYVLLFKAVQLRLTKALATLRDQGLVDEVRVFEKDSNTVRNRLTEGWFGVI